MSTAIKSKIKKWIKKWLEEPYSWNPEKQRDLKAVCFESKDPIGNGKHNAYMIHMMEWTNGEGYELVFNFHSSKGESADTKRLSLCHKELDLLFAALNDMNYFELE